MIGENIKNSVTPSEEGEPRRDSIESLYQINTNKSRQPT